MAINWDKIKQNASEYDNTVSQRNKAINQAAYKKAQNKKKEEEEEEKKKESFSSFVSSLPAYKRAYSSYTAPKSGAQTFSFPSSSKTPTTTQNIGTGALKAELADRRASGNFTMPGSHEGRVKELEAHGDTVRSQLQAQFQPLDYKGEQIGKRDTTAADFLNSSLAALAQEAAQESFLADLDRLSTRTTGRPGNISVEDFIAKSKYVPTGSGEDAKFNAVTGIYSSTGFDDILYDYINRNPKAVEIQELQDVQLGHGALGLDQGYLSQMGDREVGIFNYLYSTQGPDAAYSYINEIKNSLTARNRAEEEAMWRSMARESPADTAGMSVFSVLASPAKGLSYIGQLADYAADGTIDQNAGTNRLSYINSAIRSEASDIVETNWGAPGSFLYNTGMSMADFLYSTALSGGFGAAPGTAAAKASSGLALAIMGTGAAADTVIASKDRGLSDDQSFALGTIAGLAEIATEKFSLDALLKDPKNAVLFVLQNAGVEASEETASSLINLFADIAISKNKSEWQMSINDYISQGYSENEAFGKAFADQAKSIGLDALGGALSGGVLSGARVGANAIYNRASGAQAVDAGLPIIKNQDATDTEAQQQTQTDPLQALAEEMAAEEAEAIFPTVEERPRPKPQKSAVVSEQQQQETAPEPSWQKYTGAPRADGSNPAAQARSVARQAAESADLASMDTVERESFLQAYDMGRSGESFEADVSSLPVQSDAVYGAFFQGQDDYFNGNADRYQAYRKAEDSVVQADPVEAPVETVNQVIEPEDIVEPEQISEPVESAEAEQITENAYELFSDTTAKVQSKVTPGFVQTEYSKNLSKKESAALDNLAKAAGVSIQIDAETGEGGANGWYENGVVHIATDAENPALVVAKHEITHSLKESAPEAYRQYRDYVSSIFSDNGSIDSIVAQYKEQYAQNGVTLSNEQALDEIAADFTESLVVDPSQFEKLARENRTVAQKLFDGIRDFIQKVKSLFSGNAKAQNQSAAEEYGVSMEELLEASDLWGNALKASKNVSSTSDARFSAKGSSDILRENAALKRQNQSLKERLEYYKRQTKRTAQRSEDPKAVRKAASTLVKEYSSTADVDQVSAGLQTVFDYMGGKEVSYSEAFDMAREVGRLVVENSVEVNDDLYQEYKDLREYLRSAKLSISTEDRSGIPDYNALRKHNFGRMTLSSGPTNIDQYYADLAEQYPEFFNETRESTPEDQLLQISEVLDRIYEITESNPFSAYMDQVVDGVAGEIMETFFQLPQTKKTFADLQAEKLSAAKAKGRQKLQELQQQSRERLDLMREQNKERLEKLRKRERDVRSRQVQKLKETYSAREATGRDKRQRAELRRKITRHANTLSEKLLHPTDTKNIPESLRSAVGAALSSINQESRYTIDPETGKRIYEIDDPNYRRKGVFTKRSAAFAKLKAQYIEAIKNDENLVIDPSLLGDYEEGFQGNFDALISMGDIKLSDMTADQLQTVWQTVKAIEHAVSTYGKMLSQSKFKSTQEAAYSAKNDGSKRKERKGPLPKRASLSIENPYTFFYHLGDTGKSLFRSLRNAQDQQELMSREVAEKSSKIASQSTVEKLEKEVHQFTVSGGQKLTLSTDQVMELYELMQREQAHNHLLKGGIIQPDVKKARVKRGSESIRLTAEDLADIVSVLTEDQVKIADSLQQLMSGMLAEYGNQASMKVYGYEKFNEPHYWPIKSAPEGVQTTVEKGSGKARSIKNIGMAKSVVPDAANPLELSGVFNTFSTHTADMVDYAAWLAPMEDMNRLFNFRFRDQEGNLTGVTFKSILDGAGGRGSQQYWANLMEDIQNGISQPGDDTLTNIAAKGVGAFKGAAVGGNLRVVIQQPTAFFRASAVLSPADMAKGLAKGATRGNGWKKALKYSPIAMRKADGGFDISSPAKMKEILFGSKTKLEKFNDALSAPAGMADAVTWGKLWNACEWQVARENKSLRKGSDAFYKKVNEVFSDMIDQTQVVDGVLQRSNIMRSSNALAQQATSFMGEPIMSLNMTMRAYDDLRYTKDPKQRGKAIKHFGRTAAALVVTSAINALAQSIVDGWRDDDKDKKYWDRVLSAFTGQTGDEESAWDKATAIIFEGNFVGNLNPIGQVPFVKDVWSIIQGYDVSRTDMEVVADLVESGQKVIDSFAGEKKRTKAYAVKEMFSAGAKLFGLPVSNITRDVWGVARSIAIETGNIPLQYEMEKIIYNLSSSSNKSRFLDLAFQALSTGDMDTYNSISDDLMNTIGLLEKDISSGMESRYKNAIKKDLDMAFQALSSGDMDAYNSISDRLMNDGVPGEDITSGMKSRYDSAVKKDKSFKMSQEALDLIGVRKKYDVPEEEEEETELSPEQYKKYSTTKAEEYRKMEDGLEGSRVFDALDNATKNSALSSIEKLAEEMAMESISGRDYEYSDKWMESVDGAEDVGLEPWELALFHVVYYNTKGTKDEDGKDIEGEAKSDKVREWLEDYRGLTEEQREFLWSTEYKSEW